MMRALHIAFVVAGLVACNHDLVYVDITAIPASTDSLWMRIGYLATTPTGQTYQGSTSDFLFKAPAQGFNGATSVGLNVPPGKTLDVVVEARAASCALGHQRLNMLVAGGVTRFDMALSALPKECTALMPMGTFSRGCSAQDNCQLDEGPLVKITTRAIDVDVTEVSHGAYRACTSCTTPAVASADDADTHPQTGVTWNQAVGYCNWRGKHLLTEAEWERAARGDGAALIYPWGNTAPTCARSNYQRVPACHDGFVGVSENPDGVSPFGMLNMAGNAAEWVADLYDDTYTGVTTNPTGPTIGTQRVIRGGSYYDPPSLIRNSGRYFASPTGSDPDNNVSDDDRLLRTGFRCGRYADIPLITP